MFSEHSREIFQYQFQTAEGVAPEVRFADPIKLKRLLSIHTGGRLNEHIEAVRAMTGVEGEGIAPAREGSAEYIAGNVALGILADAMLAALDLPAFDPYSCAGVMEEEALRLLRSYIDWINAKKQNGGTSA